MPRLVIRLIIGGIILGGGWVAYQLSDFTSCSGPRVEAWFESSLIITKQSNSDFDSISSSTSLSEFSRLARMAKARYQEQQSLNTLSCLSGVQDKVVEEYYFEWKAYESASEAEFDLASDYMNKSADSQDLLLLEIEKLGIKYDWDFNY